MRFRILNWFEYNIYIEEGGSLPLVHLRKFAHCANWFVEYCKVTLYLYVNEVGTLFAYLLGCYVGIGEV